jgi:hypothetical protein
MIPKDWQHSSRRAFLAGVGSIVAAELSSGCGTYNAIVSGSTTPTAPSTPAAPVAPRPYDIEHVLITGQSLSTGLESEPVLSRTQPYQNLMFSSAALRFPSVNAVTLGTSNVQFVPLTATQTDNPGAGDNETFGNGFADSVIHADNTSSQTLPLPSAKALLISGSGLPGNVYQQLCGPTDWNASNPFWTSASGNSGSPSFQEMMSQVSSAMAIAKSQGKTYYVPCVVVVHGEFDEYNYSYEQNLVTWQKDCQAGIQAITGQTETIPFILTQTCEGAMTPLLSPTDQLQAAIQYPQSIILAGPEYHLPHNIADALHQTIHLTAVGERMLGAMVSRAFRAMYRKGTSWTPLMPTNVAINNNKVVIDYTAPVAPIVLDTSWCTDPGNFGFSYSDSGGAAITSVAVTGPTQVTLTLNQPSVATSRYVGYAAPNTDPLFGPTSGTRGCLRDSSTDAGYYDATDGVPSYNYSVRWGGNY